MLEHRKHKILLGTVMEIFLDTVDLVNTFIHNFWLHIIYSVIKIGSIGAWTYAQADLNQPAIWFVPIGIAMFITLLLLEWFESSRKYFLALLIVVAAFSWVLILSIRCNQINESIDTWKDKAKDPRQNKTDCDHNVNTLVRETHLPYFELNFSNFHTNICIARQHDSANCRNDRNGSPWSLRPGGHLVGQLLVCPRLCRSLPSR